MCQHCNQLVYRKGNFIACHRCVKMERERLQSHPSLLSARRRNDARLAGDKFNKDLSYLESTNAWHHANCHVDAMTVVKLRCFLCNKKATRRCYTCGRTACAMCKTCPAGDNDEHYLGDINLCKVCSWVDGLMRKDTQSGGGVGGVHSERLRAMIRMISKVDPRGAFNVT